MGLCFLLRSLSEYNRETAVVVKIYIYIEIYPIDHVVPDPSPV